MKELGEILRRNRKVIRLFLLMVLIPASIFTVLIIRAVRGETIRVEHQVRQRQQQIVRLVEADLKAWLFSTDGDSAMSKSLLKFEIEPDEIAFPEYHFSISSSGARRPFPFPSTSQENSTMMQSIEEIYHPRIHAFLRDFNAGKSSGAQYFRRLKAIIVRLPAQDRGYILASQNAEDYVNKRLMEFSAGETFSAQLSVGDVTGNPPLSAAAYGLDSFPFFQVDFTNKESVGFRAHSFAYSMALLLLVTLLGSTFVYRAVSHEMALSQLRTDFVSAVSHEFRSPLSSILALSERLESAKVADPRKLVEYHQMIGEEARRLSLLVDRLLDFAQMEVGKKVYSLGRVDLAGIVQEAIESCGKLGRVRVSTGEQGAPLWILGDRTAVRHCIQNVIENALKYSPPESPVTVACERTGTWIFVDVSDRGVGIPLSEQERIFEKFYRGKSASHLNIQGAGIGLALVKYVMESHGGTVTVESQPGEGSRFRLSMPGAEA